MQLIIHRGTHEIGGNCIEVRSRQTKILLDFGLPLDFATRTPEEQEHIRQEAIEWARDTDAIFISHCHADHYGLLSALPHPLLTYATTGTITMIRAISTLSGQAHAEYLKYLQPLPRQKENRPFEPLCIGDIRITSYTVDHSAYDACAFLIEAEGRRLLYSGDLRLHGVKKSLYRQLPKRVDCLLLEGTHLANDTTYPTETQIAARLKRQFRAEGDMLHYVWCSNQNIDRIVQLYKAARASSRKLIVDTYTAFILEKIHDLNPAIPSPLSPFHGDDVFRYFRLNKFIRRLEESGELKMIERLQELPTVEPADIGRHPERYVWMIRPSMLPYMQKFIHIPCVVVTSTWEGYEQEHPEWISWIAEHGFPNPHIHTSGHADTGSLKRIIRHVKPAQVIPIHTSCPESISTLCPHTKVRLPLDNEPIEW